MSFWEIFLPLFCALSAWSISMEVLQIILGFILAKRQLKREESFQKRLEEMGGPGGNPALDMLSRILSEGQASPYYGLPYNSPATVSGTVERPGQYV